MIIPNTLNILGLPVIIKKINSAIITETKEVAEGRCDLNNLYIAINNSAPIPNKDSTFLHEIIHFLNDRLTIELSEHQISLLETGLYQVIHTNKLRF